VFAQAGPLVAAAVLSIVLARTIGPSGNGRYALLATLVGITSMVVTLGLHSGITYEVSRRRWSVGRAFRTSYLVALALGLLGMAAGLGCFLLLHDSVFRGIGLGVALLALSSLPAVIAYEYGAAIMLARERYEAYATVQVAHAAALLLVGAGLALAIGLTGAVAGMPAAALGGAIIAALLLGREAARDTGPDSGDSLRRALRFGLQSWGANLLQQVNYRVDIIILGGFATSRDVGVYSVALTLTGVAWVLPQGLQTVLFPRVASLDEAMASGELTSEESDEAPAKAVRHGVLMTLPVALLVTGLLLVAVPLLYGHEFDQTRGLGLVLLPGVLLLGIGKILSAAIAGRGHPRLTLYIAAISMPMTLALYLVLIPPYHAWGAALASSVSYGLSALLALFFFRRVTGIELSRAFVPRAEDVADYRALVRIARAWRPGR
jgi:O-antigen/teichoic acid export membrane protein